MFAFYVQYATGEMKFENSELALAKILPADAVKVPFRLKIGARLKSLYYILYVRATLRNPRSPERWRANLNVNRFSDLEKSASSAPRR